MGVRSEYRGQMACLILYFRNKTPAAVTSFTTTLDLDESEKSNLTWDIKGLPESNINQGAQSQQVIMFEAKKVFEKSPTIRISYLAGALQAVTLKLPVTIHKFMDPAELTADDFFKRWKQIGGAPREAQSIFGLSDPKDPDKEINETFIRRVIEGFRWGILNAVDPNQKNFVGASVVHSSEGGKLGCLMRLEPNYTTQVWITHTAFCCSVWVFSFNSDLTACCTDGTPYGQGNRRERPANSSEAHAGEDRSRLLHDP